MSAEIVNRTNGEAKITATSGDHSWGVLFDMQAVAHLEALMGQSVMQFIAERSLALLGVTDLQRMVIAGTEGYRRRNGNGQQALSPNAALDVIKDSGGLRRLAPVLVEALVFADGLGLQDDAQEGSDGDTGPPGHGAKP